MKNIVAETALHQCLVISSDTFEAKQVMTSTVTAGSEND